MAKTRRTKTNRSPGRPYRNSRAFIAEIGDKIRTRGVRGRTKVVRVVSGARLHRVRETEVVPQLAAPKPVGDRKPKGIFVGRQYTGQPRSKPYPVRGVKRGGTPAPVAVGLMARAAKAVKRVLVQDQPVPKPAAAVAR